MDLAKKKKKKSFRTEAHLLVGHIWASAKTSDQKLRRDAPGVSVSPFPLLSEKLDVPRADS